jgi:hypothetical protein
MVHDSGNIFFYLMSSFWAHVPYTILCWSDWNKNMEDIIIALKTLQYIWEGQTSMKI